MCALSENTVYGDKKKYVLTYAEGSVFSMAKLMENL